MKAKGVLIGCGIVLLIGLVAVSLCGYFGTKFVKGFSEDMKMVQESFQQLNEKYIFEAPADGLIRQDQFQQWISVRQELTGSIAGYDSLTKSFSLNTIQKLKEHTLNMVQQLTASLDLKQISPKEYIWISQQMVGALQSGDIQYDAEFQAITAAFEEMQEKQQHQGNNSSIEDLAAPVTSEQINRIKTLLRSNKDGFLETIKVFYADMLIIGYASGQGVIAVKEDKV